MAKHSDHVANLARQHLGTAVVDTQVWHAYAQELEKHLKLYPAETNFHIRSQPCEGLGVVTCLNGACNGINIPLCARLSADDGGFVIGLGSLSSYRVHLSTHPAHASTSGHGLFVVLSSSSPSDVANSLVCSEPLLKVCIDEDLVLAPTIPKVDILEATPPPASSPLSEMSSLPESDYDEIDDSKPRASSSMQQQPNSSGYYAERNDYQPTASSSNTNIDVSSEEVKPVIPRDYVVNNTELTDSNEPTSSAILSATGRVNNLLVTAGNVEELDGNATVEKAMSILGLENLYHPLPGMEVPLMPHQAIGVAWMYMKETISKAKGGILGDEMGLGKTVQMIATIATNRPTNPLRKATLIIAPVALLEQWKLEIEVKTNLGLKCLIYHGKTKTKSLAKIKQYDIVLTSFNTLAADLPDEVAAAMDTATKKRKREQAFTDDSEDEGMSQKMRGKRKIRSGPGMLFQIEAVMKPRSFERFRVCIDEAQNIRNRHTRVSTSVTKLNAIHRWCLTGTPIINGVSDAFPLLRFLKIEYYESWYNYNAYMARFEKRQPRFATSRLQDILSKHMLRRTKDSTLNGKRIITLPPKDINLCMLEFTAAEREIYNAVQSKSQARFNRFLREGTVLKHYTQVFTMLLRLRQLCVHPCLIQEGAAGLLPSAEGDSMDNFSGAVNIEQELERAARLVSHKFVENLCAKLRQATLDRMAAELESGDAALDGIEYECPICCDSFTNAVITACGHAFCYECIITVINGVQHDDHRFQANERPCPACRGPISADQLFAKIAFEPREEIADDMADVEDDIQHAPEKSLTEAGPSSKNVSRRVTRRMRNNSSYKDGDSSDCDSSGDEYGGKRASKRKLGVKRKGKGKQRASVPSVNSKESGVVFGFKLEDDEEATTDRTFLPSTKLKKMMDTLQAWADEHPDEKVIIVSQWTQCLQLASNYLMENGILHVKYQGDMDREARNQSVKVFMSDSKANVMLLSLKCGGVGLNLTRANRVISLDPGWSEAIESQAFDRVHRLGQTRPVVVERYIVRHTIEERVLALQERKKAVASVSLGEGSSKALERLSVRELAGLFGLNSENEPAMSEE